MTAKSTSMRLDALLVERGLADSIAKAQAMILAGEVSVDAARADKAGTLFPSQVQIEISSRAGKFVSRGGLKLEGALEDFAIDPNARVCMDVGASTGGFTDCLLQHGAARVYAVDVNLDQLAWKLRKDPRVLRVIRNARDLRADDVPEPVDFLAIDVSFISVGKVLPAALAAAKPGAEFLILVKPQFELPREDVGPGGIVSSPALHDKAIAAVRKTAAQLGLEVLGARPSRIPGAEGNQEYFLHARKKGLE
jgi:23S rRNA (cytidine1920-2'-O)/16S rRNA (cytidine1409-2'-O)-methyltransferase